VQRRRSRWLGKGMNESWSYRQLFRKREPSSCGAGKGSARFRRARRSGLDNDLTLLQRVPYSTINACHHLHSITSILSPSSLQRTPSLLLAPRLLRPGDLLTREKQLRLSPSNNIAALQRSTAMARLVYTSPSTLACLDFNAALQPFVWPEAQSGPCAPHSFEGGFCLRIATRGRKERARED